MGACVSVETLFKATELCMPSWGADGGGKGPRTELGRGELQVRPAAGQQPRAGGRGRAVAAGAQGRRLQEGRGVW